MRNLKALKFCVVLVVIGLSQYNIRSQEAPNKLAAPSPATQDQPFSISVSNYAIGTIRDAATKRILGNGFVATVGRQARVVTCWHVGELMGNAALRKSYQSVENETDKTVFLSNLEPAVSLEGYDLEAFNIAKSFSFVPPELGDLKPIHPGDVVLYVGYNALDNSLAAAEGNVSAVGSVLNDGATTDFVEFEGSELPGYSGGPVFDRNGKVIAVIREGWTQRGLQPGMPDAFVNRAFSVEKLKSYAADK